MKKSIVSILFSVLTFFAGSASAVPPGGAAAAPFNNVEVLARQQCVNSPQDAVDVWTAVARPPLTGGPVIGDFANPARDCARVCRTWVNGCVAAASGFGLCITKTAGAALNQVKAEAATILNAADKKFCLNGAKDQIKIIRAAVKQDVVDASANCRNGLQDCIDQCILAVTP